MHLENKVSFHFMRTFPAEPSLEINNKRQAVSLDLFRSHQDFFQASRSVMADLWSGSLYSRWEAWSYIRSPAPASSPNPMAAFLSQTPSWVVSPSLDWGINGGRGRPRRQAQVAVALIGYRLALNGAWVEELCCHGDSTICDCAPRQSRTRLSRSLSLSVTLILIHPADAGQYEHRREGRRGKMCVCVCVCRRIKGNCQKAHTKESVPQIEKGLIYLFRQDCVVL